MGSQKLCDNIGLEFAGVISVYARSCNNMSAIPKAPPPHTHIHKYVSKVQ